MPSIAAVAVLIGVVMLFLPEPITSVLGLLVILAGLARYLLAE